MPTRYISHLTLEQEALLFGYRDRWKQQHFKGHEGDRHKAAEAVKMAYVLSGYREPETIHCSSPLEGFERLLDFMQETIGDLEDSRLGQPVGTQLQDKLLAALVSQLSQQLDKPLLDRLQVSPYSQLGILVGAQIGTHFTVRQFIGLVWGVGGSRALEQHFPWIRPLTKMLLQLGFQQTSSFFDLPIDVQAYDAEGRQVTDRLNEIWGVILSNEQGLQLLNCLEPELWAAYCGFMDFFFSVLDCDRDEKKWFTLKYLIEHCGWILPFERVALVCARPTHLLVDSDNRIHAEGEPAIQYSDGLRVYAKHGVRRSHL
ncbi:DUF6745 domain-containing protein [Synechococcus sp. PCC 7336]|uniref:DUF6745 domain-containing protein n=1 Tax=Synechococcus sp. PCC 7336 TaxID=195250 RepID=UPI000345F53C|nr:hypothetical protein [Synechococcus sp. PCC 7336]